jgi:NitT/TauT family transport system substrate-binding protein
MLSSAPTLSRRTLAAATAAVLTGTITGCASTRNTRAATTPADKVTYLTAFGAAARESYAYVAAAKQFFTDAHLDVTIQVGSPELNVKSLVAGQAQFASVDGSGELIRHSGGTSPGTTIVAAVHQQTLIAIVALAGSGISGARDLTGKTIGVATNAVPKTLFPGYAKQAGLDASTVKWVETAPDQLPRLLLAKTVPAIGLFAPGIAGLEKQAGKGKVTTLPYSEYLRDLFGTVIITPEKLPHTNPDLVRRFVGALMRGVLYALDHPDETGQIIHAAQPAIAADVAAREYVLMRDYTLPPKGVQLGVMEPARVARAIASLQSLGLITSGLTPEMVVVPDMLGNSPTIP